jgi:hypothetical protein
LLQILDNLLGALAAHSQPLLGQENSPRRRALRGIAVGRLAAGRGAEPTMKRLPSCSIECIR